MLAPSRPEGASPSHPNHPMAHDSTDTHDTTQTHISDVRGSRLHFNRDVFVVAECLAWSDELRELGELTFHFGEDLRLLSDGRNANRFHCEFKFTPECTPGKPKA